MHYRKNIFWGYVSQFLQYGVALLLLPILLRKLSSEELGVWYVLLTISAFVIMMDLGFTPTLAMNVSYVMGGARRLKRQGFETVEVEQSVDYGLLRALIAGAKRIFFWLSVAALIILGTLGTWFIIKITQGKIPLQTVLTTWALFVPATILNLYYKYFTPLLQGRGLFAGYYRANALASMSFGVSIVILLSLGCGLPGIAAGYLISAIVGRWLSCRFLMDHGFVEALRNAPEANVSATDIVRTIWNTAWKQGVVVVGAFLILRANSLISSVYLGLAVTSSYALSLQACSVISSASMVTFTIQQQKIAQFRVKSGMTSEIRKLIEIGLTSALTLYVVLAAFLVTFGNRLIKVIGGHSFLLGAPLLAWVVVMACLEMNHSISASIIVTRNEVPFIRAALISGVAIVILSIIGLQYFHLGVFWLIATQFAVQLAYNNWKWPGVVAREIGEPYYDIIKNGLVHLLDTASAVCSTVLKRA